MILQNLSGVVETISLPMMPEIPGIFRLTTVASTLAKPIIVPPIRAKIKSARTLSA
ncbi:MAG: hypothetical protein ABI839_07680 [Verrucomicrobiota bacterium]